jgi:hypothetical protein
MREAEDRSLDSPVSVFVGACRPACRCSTLPFCLSASACPLALMQVIGDVLDFSRIEAGKLELERIRFSPMRIVGHVGSLMAEIARCKRVRLTVRCSGDVPASVLGDPERLKQCLFNLLSNACKVRARALLPVARGGCPVSVTGVQAEAAPRVEGCARVWLTSCTTGRRSPSQSRARSHRSSALPLAPRPLHIFAVHPLRRKRDPERVSGARGCFRRRRG